MSYVYIDKGWLNLVSSVLDPRGPPEQQLQRESVLEAFARHCVEEAPKYCCPPAQGCQAQHSLSQNGRHSNGLAGNRQGVYRPALDPCDPPVGKQQQGCQAGPTADDPDQSWSLFSTSPASSVFAWPEWQLGSSSSANHPKPANQLDSSTQHKHQTFSCRLDNRNLALEPAGPSWAGPRSHPQQASVSGSALEQPSLPARVSLEGAYAPGDVVLIPPTSAKAPVLPAGPVTPPQPHHSLNLDPSPDSAPPYRPHLTPYTFAPQHGLPQHWHSTPFHAAAPASCFPTLPDSLTPPLGAPHQPPAANGHTCYHTYDTASIASPDPSSTSSASLTDSSSTRRTSYNSAPMGGHLCTSFHAVTGDSSGSITSGLVPALPHSTHLDASWQAASVPGALANGTHPIFAMLSPGSTAVPQAHHAAAWAAEHASPNASAPKHGAVPAAPQVSHGQPPFTQSPAPPQHLPNPALHRGTATALAPVPAPPTPSVQAVVAAAPAVEAASPHAALAPPALQGSAPLEKGASGMAPLGQLRADKAPTDTAFSSEGTPVAATAAAAGSSRPGPVAQVKAAANGVSHAPAAGGSASAATTPTSAAPSQAASQATAQAKARLTAQASKPPVAQKAPSGPAVAAAGANTLASQTGASQSVQAPKPAAAGAPQSNAAAPLGVPAGATTVKAAAARPVINPAKLAAFFKQLSSSGRVRASDQDAVEEAWGALAEGYPEVDPRKFIDDQLASYLGLLRLGCVRTNDHMRWQTLLKAFAETAQYLHHHRPDVEEKRPHYVLNSVKRAETFVDSFRAILTKDGGLAKDTVMKLGPDFMFEYNEINRWRGGWLERSKATLVGMRKPIFPAGSSLAALEERLREALEA